MIGYREKSARRLAANPLGRNSSALYSIGQVQVLEDFGLHVSKKEQQFVSCVECDRAEAPTNEALGTGVAARSKL